MSLTYYISIDEDLTVSASIEMIADRHGHEYELAFVNGGDQKNKTISKREICEEAGINLIDELVVKIQSSNWLLK